MLNTEQAMPTVPSFAEPFDQNTSNPTWLERQLMSQCSLPYNKLADYANLFLVIVLSWVFLYCVLGDEMLPSHDMFRLIVLLLASWLGGVLIRLIRLPDLLGMLFAGIILRSVGFYHVTGVYTNIEEILRNISLSIILIKAGLGLDAKALFRLKYTVVKLSILPCIGEAIIAAVIAFYVMGFSWLWGLLLGFLLSPISPAVVVPTLLELQEAGYGTDKGIATLVIAATSIDDIAAISVFGVLLSNIFSTGDDLVVEICRGPMELILGLIFGVLWGIVCVLIPHRDDNNASKIRSIFVGLGGIVAVLLSTELDFQGCGTLACITAAFVANIGWNLQKSGSNEEVVSFFSSVWVVAEPVMFGLIGCEIDVTVLDWDSVISACAVIIGALVLRIFICWLALYGVGLNVKEKIFVILAWLPKATVQAALGPQALQMARRENSLGIESDDTNLRNAELVLITAVLSILITAPIGAVAINLTGTKFLTKS